MCCAGERKGDIALGNNLDFQHAFNNQYFLEQLPCAGIFYLLVITGHIKMNEAKFMSFGSLAHSHLKN